MNKDKNETKQVINLIDTYFEKYFLCRTDNSFKQEDYYDYINQVIKTHLRNQIKNAETTRNYYFFSSFITKNGSIKNHIISYIDELNIKYTEKGMSITDIQNILKSKHIENKELDNIEKVAVYLSRFDTFYINLLPHKENIKSISFVKDAMYKLNYATDINKVLYWNFMNENYIDTLIIKVIYIPFKIEYKKVF